MYPACNADASYCHLWPAPLYNIFPHYLLTPILLTWRIRWAPNNASKWQIGFNSAFKGLNGTIFVGGGGEGGSYWTQNVCFDFLYKFVWNISYSKKNWARCDEKCEFISMWSTRYSCQILMKPEFSRHVFEKYRNIKLHENPSSGSRLVTCRRTYGQRDMLKLRVFYFLLLQFLQFCERA